MANRTTGNISVTRIRTNPEAAACRIELFADGSNLRFPVADIYCADTGSEQEANAEFIVRAWNSHDDMLAALLAIAEFMPTTTASEGGASKYSANVAAADMVRAAIAKATGDAA